MLPTCKSALSFHINLFSTGYNAAILVRRMAIFVMPYTDVNRLPSSLMSLSLEREQGVTTKRGLSLVTEEK